MLSKEELEAYCHQYYLPIYKYCMSRLSNKEDAEDATQETFSIFSNKGHLLEERHIKAWLYAVAHNMILKEYKRRTLKHDKETVYDEELFQLSMKVRNFEETMVEYYMEKYIDEIYSRLPERDKELFDLYSDGNLKTSEIAQILGLDTHACSMRKKRLKDKCRDIMMEFLFF